jgi:hypothetical protein
MNGVEVDNRDLAVRSVSLPPFERRQSQELAICDRAAFALCPVFCRMIFVGEDHDADQRDLFFLP